MIGGNILFISQLAADKLADNRSREVLYYCYKATF